MKMMKLDNNNKNFSRRKSKYMKVEGGRGEKL